MMSSWARSAAALALLPLRTTSFVAHMSTGSPLNVLGTPLKACSLPGGPTTGWRRDGYCSTDDNDRGQHCVCSEVTQEFLDYTKAQGNDLSTPLPHFPGLKAGDRWCLCSSRWLQAQRAGKAPLVVLDSTHEKAMEVVPLALLKEYSSEHASAAPSETEL
ncbi:unnamed protein product [Ectocarpus sp. CCAP 1310/34]|nr:unnamed protein product [Ectocarpus sp. CCAP 1310/34]